MPHYACKWRLSTILKLRHISSIPILALIETVKAETIPKADTVYTSNLPYKCIQCPRRFFTSRQVMNHSIAVHENYQCSRCPIKFKDKAKYDEHMRKHGESNQPTLEQKMNILSSAKPVHLDLSLKDISKPMN